MMAAVDVVPDVIYGDENATIESVMLEALSFEEEDPTEVDARSTNRIQLEHDDFEEIGSQTPSVVGTGPQGCISRMIMPLC